MEPEAARIEFLTRYYNWALHDFRREIENGFPFLGKFKNGPLWHVRDMMSGVCREKQLFLASALVKRFHKEAIAALGEFITPEEMAMCEEYLSRALLPSLKEPADSGVHSNKARLIRLVRRQLEARGMRVFEEECLPGVLSYRSIINGWQIITRIHTRERHAHLAYEHAIWSIQKMQPVILRNGQYDLWPIKLHHWISLSAWLGISSRTEWDDIVDADSPQVAEDLGDLCTHFLEAAPTLLNGIEES